ncbi:hypothetical protein CUMW_122540 [Citrus unshiu]|uniref:Lipoxygenase domain-containing protein n=1 Tax=Citrus unshiu TaxID=55188 RepID=A0A2H5PC01_CITUN|nr:hypothetical protein CUMW_122540 [Citrus unshiu]
MVVLDTLSSHSPGDKYLGNQMEAANANKELNNRTGAGMVPYELLKPFSDPGLLGKGDLYSISI